MITCKEVSTLVSSGGLPAAPLTVRLGVRLHLAMCRHCRAFKHQLDALARTAGALNRAFEREPAPAFEKMVVQRLLS
jgi:anti-sigma factor ChrR (cupin superfamily)